MGIKVKERLLEVIHQLFAPHVKVGFIDACQALGVFGRCDTRKSLARRHILCGLDNNAPQASQTLMQRRELLAYTISQSRFVEQEERTVGSELQSSFGQLILAERVVLNLVEHLQHKGSVGRAAS